MSKQLTIEVEGNNLKIKEVGNPQNACSIVFHRTLRIPDDGKVYPLPPSLGQFPLCKVDDYLDKVPADWKKTGGVFFPMHQREAMWMAFQCPSERPKAMKIAVGKVNAINGKPWSNSLEKDDYITIPKQPWLDGINAGGEGTIKQFVAMPLGSGYSVEAQVTGEEKFGGIQMIVFDSKEDERVRKFPHRAPVSAPVFGSSPTSNYAYAPTSASYSPISPSYSPTSPSYAAPHSCIPSPLYSAPTSTSVSTSFSMVGPSMSGPPPMMKAGPPPPAPMMGGPPPPPPSSSSYSSSPAPPPAASIFSAPQMQSCIAPQPQRKRVSQVNQAPAPKQEAKEMSLSAGGSMKQEISKDEFGLAFWDQTTSSRIYIRIVNSEMYEQITGMKAPPTPITAQTYSSYGYPWFDVYNETPQNSIDQSNVLNQVKSVSQMDKDKYAWPQQDDTSIQLAASQVKSLHLNKNQVRDGDW